MYDCLSFYITQRLPHISNATGILQGFATSLVENASLPSWDAFQKILVQLEAEPLLDLQTTSFITRDIKWWAAERESRESNSDLTAHDICTLLPGQHLNDVIVNHALQLLSSQGSTPTPDGKQKFYVWNNFLIMEIAAQEDVSRWKSKAGIKSLYEYDFHLIPIYLNAHWILAKVDLQHQTITIFNSISQVGIEQSVFTNLQR